MSEHSARLKNAFLNIGTTTFVYGITMIMSFVVRAILTRSLGQTYVGLNGVMTSVISSLSIADLGIDSVFVFMLYKPISKQNQAEIKGLMILFKKIYLIIGSVFLILGVAIIPFLRYIIGAQAMGIEHVTLIYFLFMLNTGLSYFFAYYRVLLNADQKFYIIARITFMVTTIINIVQIATLLYFKNFVIYVILLLTSTVVINVIVGYEALKRYQLKESTIKPVKPSKEMISVLIKNTIGGISNKLGGIVVISSDNILLANFTKLSYVGIYSNYSLITAGASSLIVKIISSVTASVGNLGTEQNTKKNFDIFSKMTFGMNIVVGIILMPVIIGFSSIINLWVGPGNALPYSSVVLLTLNFCLQIIRFPSLTFIDAFGLQWVQRWKSVVEALINLIFSLFFLIVLNLGLNGVLLGTLISNLGVVNWYEPYLVLRQTGGKRYLAFVKSSSRFWLFYVIQIVVSVAMFKLDMFEASDFVTLMTAFLAGCINMFILYVMFRKNEHFKYFIKLLHVR